jgi:uncharacterized membrane protein YbjE (DUF340 family)
MVIAIVVLGVLIGFLVRELKSFLKVINVLVNASIYILLLLLGISVGSNRDIMAHLGTIGLKSLALSMAAIAGSMAVGFIVQRFAFREKANEE